MQLRRMMNMKDEVIGLDKKTQERLLDLLHKTANELDSSYQSMSDWFHEDEDFMESIEHRAELVNEVFSFTSSLNKENQYDRELTISFLESNQENGAYNGEPEAKMNFNNLTDQELEWYYVHWIDEEHKNLYFTDEKIEILDLDIVGKKQNYLATVIYEPDNANEQALLIKDLDTNKQSEHTIDKYGYVEIDGRSHSLTNRILKDRNAAEFQLALDKKENISFILTKEEISQLEKIIPDIKKENRTPQRSALNSPQGIEF